MQAVRKAIGEMKAANWSDDDIVAFLCNRPTPEQNLELRSELDGTTNSTRGTRVARLLEHEVKNYEAPAHESE